jgi:hypothetical protein
MLKAITRLQSIRYGFRHPTDGDVAAYTLDEPFQGFVAKTNRRKGFPIQLV